MDPSKRICLKNLPESVTKRELAEIIRNRTGVQPHSIDLGIDAAGNTRRYAHFSCEGAKNVLQVLGDGMDIKGSHVQAFAAHMHYSFRYAEARRKREREEAEAAQELADFWEKERARFLERTNGELSKKMPKSFFSTRRRYASVASEIAQKAREAHQQRRGKPLHAQATNHYARGMNGNEGESGNAADAAAAAHPVTEGAAAASTVAAPATAPRNASAPATKFAGKRRPQSKGAAKSAAPPPPPAPVAAPPQPDKNARKLMGLQSKLAALKEKMQKK